MSQTKVQLIDGFDIDTSVPDDSLVIDSSGNVGLGTSSPSSALDVEGIITAKSGAFDAGGFLNKYGSDTNSRSWWIKSDTHGYGDFTIRQSTTRTGSTYDTKFIINSSGNVGVGTTSPNAKLDVKGEIQFGSNATYYGSIDHDAASTGANIYNSVDTGGHIFKRNSTIELMRIDGSGRLLVGTSSYFAYASTNRVSIGFSGLGFEYGMVLSALNGVQTGTRWMEFADNTGVRGNIDWSGSAVRYNTSSDYRLKENIVSISDAISRLEQLNPCRFNFIEFPDQTVDGFIAHEAQAVVPEAVSGEKDAVDDKGNPVYQGIDQSKLVPLLTAALQEAIERIETLEAEVAALKAQ